VQTPRKITAASGRYVGSLERVTAKGVPVKLDLYQAIDDGIQDSWVVHLVEAHTANGPAGYLKISFIPQTAMDRWYPDAFTWQARHGGSGWDWILRDFIDKADSEWSRAEVILALKTCDHWPYFYQSPEWKEQCEKTSDAQLRATWQERRQDLSTEYERAYQEFFDHHLDRPKIDYIRVYDEYDKRPYYRGKRRERKRPLGVNSQHLGIGTVMYETGALWMHKQGLRLYASGLQSESAKGAWAALGANGLVQTIPGSAKKGNKTRQFFDVERLLDERPELDAFVVAS
jgi:hypothetical protein